MSRWRRQQRKRAGQRRWIGRRLAEFDARLSEALQAEMPALFIPQPGSKVRSPREALADLRASLQRYVQDPPRLGPSELVKLEDLYR